MTRETDQIVIRFTDSNEVSQSDLTLGFTTDHRRLFAALADGWLRPLPSQPGILIGVRAYTDEVSDHSSRYPIFVRVKLRPMRLPHIDIHVFRDGGWTESTTTGVRATDTAIFWPGTLPTFAISELYVCSDEQCARLRGLAKSVSNVDLSPYALNVMPESEPSLKIHADPPLSAPRFVVPDDVDAIQGALSMAIWGVPRTAPWMDVLASSLSGEPAGLARATALVEAHWLQQPPWLPPADGPQIDIQHCLWRAAISIPRTLPSVAHSNPIEIAQAITAQALHLVEPDSRPAIMRWSDTTINILRGDVTISLEHWREVPVGLALQLLLTRPVPAGYKEWYRGLPNIPPSIAWTATILCGLFRGYRRLDTQFRGDFVQRELVALHALDLSDHRTALHEWVAGRRNVSVTWRKVLNRFVLYWSGREIASKQENARSKWYSANFEDAGLRDQAIAIATQQGWPCVYKEFQSPDGPTGVRGHGQVRTDISPNEIQVHGPIYMRIPATLSFPFQLDIREFLRLVSVEPGPIPEPLVSTGPTFHVHSGRVPGLSYVPNFISAIEERQLIRTIDTCNWDSKSLKRRVQQYGWEYDYKLRKVDMNSWLGPLPDWAEHLALRLVSATLLDQLPNQLIVNDYRFNQGIAAHIDNPAVFADGIAMLSLNESWEMVFWSQDGDERIPQLLDRRSVAIMKDAARFRWKHGIPGRKYQSDGNRRVRRISLTFRTVIAS